MLRWSHGTFLPQVDFVLHQKAMADPAWIALRNRGCGFMFTGEWQRYLVPENEAAWPSGYRMAKIVTESKVEDVILLPLLHYQILANAYAELDPECIGRRGSLESHIQVLPADLRRIIRGNLLQYRRDDDSHWIIFAGTRVGIGKMPRVIVKNSGGVTIVDHIHKHRNMCRTYAAQLGASVAELEDYFGGPQACENCRLDTGTTCSAHADRRDEILAAQDQLVALCATPPLPK